MAYPMDYDLARLHINDMLRDAERERLARQVVAGQRSGAIDSSGFRERLSRLVGNLPLLPTGPRPAGT